MLKRLQTRWKIPSLKLSKTIRYCKICFKEINDYSLFNLISNQNYLCKKCFSTLKAEFINFDVGTIKVTAIYNYDETIKKLIYTYKGCGDYELKDIFISRYKNYLRFLYHDYVIVYPPSTELDNQKRGFNHVKEIFKSLNLPIYDVFKKVENEKQSSKNKKDRLNINKIIMPINIEILEGKKVLIVDDIYTTGGTLFRCIELVKSIKPKAIKALVIAKTIDLEKREKN